MPKETVRLSEDRALIVQWAKDHGDVSIGVDGPHPFRFSWPAQEGGVGEVNEEYRSLFAMVSSRRNLNQLIRVLRRARDDAMGKDE